MPWRHGSIIILVSKADFMPTTTAHVNGPCSIRIQSILYKTNLRAFDLALENLARAIELALRHSALRYAEIVLGDCSPAPILTPEMVSDRQSRYRNHGISLIEYHFFNDNLGSAAGHNRLLKWAEADLLLFQNPDVVVAPNVLIELLEPFHQPGVGQVEARQIPLEHPKDYDPLTRDTGWASTACSLVPRSVINEVGPFDEGTFFLYCDDVDLSWRIRLAGYRVVFQPSAVVFHDKRLSREGKIIVSAAEQYYSAESALLLSYKYSRPDLVSKILEGFSVYITDATTRAAAEYHKRIKEGRLPIPIDSDHRVAEFINGAYTKHRF